MDRKKREMMEEDEREASERLKELKKQKNSCRKEKNA